MSAMPTIYPRLAYRDVPAAVKFLTAAFGLEERDRLESDGAMLVWLGLGDGVVMLGMSGPAHHDVYSPRETGRITAIVNVRVSDIDAHHARALAAGARVVTPLQDMPFGRRYEAFDLEGHRWNFLQPPDGGYSPKSSEAKKSR